jgi:hypothetical protein
VQAEQTDGVQVSETYLLIEQLKNSLIASPVSMLFREFSNFHLAIELSNHHFQLLGQQSNLTVAGENLHTQILAMMNQLHAAGDDTSGLALGLCRLDDNAVSILHLRRIRCPRRRLRRSIAANAALDFRGDLSTTSSFLFRSPKIYEVIYVW